MKARHLLFAALGVMALPVTASNALLVKVSVNFGPTVTGPDNGTLVVMANPGDLLIITWALGTDSSIGVYRGLVPGVDGTEISRFGGSALELTGQASIRLATRTPQSLRSSSITRGPTELPSDSPGTAASCGGSGTP